MKNIKRLILNKYEMYIVPVFLIIVVIAVSFLVLIPTLRGSIESYPSIAELETKLTGLQKKRGLLEAMKLDTSLRFLEDAKAALPNEKDAASILIAMENLSGRTQAIVSSISFSPGVVSTDSASARSEPKSRRSANFLNVSLSAIGTDEQIREFIKSLFNSRRLFDLEQVSFSLARSGANITGANMSIIAYYLPPISKIGSVDSDLPELTGDEKSILATLGTMPIESEVLALAPGAQTSESARKTNLFSP